MWQIIELSDVAKNVAQGKIPQSILDRYDAWKNLVRDEGPRGLFSNKGLHDHALGGELEGLRASSLSGQWRVVYYIEKSALIANVVRVSAHDYSGLEALAKRVRSARKTGRDMDSETKATVEKILAPFRTGRGAVLAKRRATLTPAKALRIYREFAGYTQVELAARSGISQNAISGIENGRLSMGVERAKRLAKALGHKPSMLLFPND